MTTESEEEFRERMRREDAWHREQEPSDGTRRVHQLTQHELQQVVDRSVRQTLTSLGIAHEDPTRMQRNFAFLDNMRTTTEQIQRKGFLAMVGLVISGLGALLWMGIKAALGKG